jgi:DNA-directed RNA polymerase specialized sigma24 family protein
MRLDPLERRVLAMIYIDGLTQQQVAKRLGRQRDAVASAVARALRVVAESIETPADPSRASDRGRLE